MFIKKNDLIIILLLFWQMMNSKFDYLHKFFQEKKTLKIVSKISVKKLVKKPHKKKKKNSRGGFYHLIKLVKSLMIE